MIRTTQSRTILHFASRAYPTFGRGSYSDENPPASVSNSPYYWQFMFLRLNQDYIDTIKKKGNGKLLSLYSDFGDIHTCDFKAFWNEHAHLFAEPKHDFSMSIANSQDELAPFGNSEVLNLVVPLTWSQRSLKKRFAELVLSKVPKGKRGISAEDSDAKFRIEGKWRIDAFSNAYTIYTIKNNGESLAWADVAIRAKLPITKGMKEGQKTSATSDARRVATILAMRHYKRAEAFIKAAATNHFPKT